MMRLTKMQRAIAQPGVLLPTVREARRHRARTGFFPLHTRVRPAGGRVMADARRDAFVALSDEIDLLFGDGDGPAWVGPVPPKVVT